MDAAEISADHGVIRIADRVLAMVVRDACLEVPGVAGMDDRFSGSFSSRIVGEDAEGVHVSIQDNKVGISLYLRLYHGLRAPEVALHVQEKVKETILYSAGLSVSSVDVFVQGIVFDQEGQFKDGGK